MLLFFSALAIAAVEIHDQKIGFPAVFHHTVTFSNPYSDQVSPTKICLYCYSDIKKDVCQDLDQGHSAFILPSGTTWGQIQRIVFRGKNLSTKDEVLSCIAYEGHHNDTLSSLEKVGDTTIEVNYVGDHYMVCSLMSELH